MDKKAAALIAISLAAMTSFIGCQAVDNTFEGNSMIQMERIPENTVYIETTSFTETTAYSSMTSASETTDTMTTQTKASKTSETTDTTTKIKMAGYSQIRHSTPANVITPTVAVTATAPKPVYTTTQPPVQTTALETTETSVETEPPTEATSEPEETAPVTTYEPDNNFDEERDLSFFTKGREFTLGKPLPELQNMTYTAEETSNAEETEVRYLYQFEGFQVLTAERDDEEIILSVIVTSDKLMTAKGVSVGDAAESAKEAYGDLETLEFSTESGKMLAFVLDESKMIQEIRFVMVDEV